MPPKITEIAVTENIFNNSAIQAFFEQENLSMRQGKFYNPRKKILTSSMIKDIFLPTNLDFEVCTKCTLENKSTAEQVIGTISCVLSDGNSKSLELKILGKIFLGSYGTRILYIGPAEEGTTSHSIIEIRQR